jgi:uncharacterized protein VirK/YbjX
MRVKAEPLDKQSQRSDRALILYYTKWVCRQAGPLRGVRSLVRSLLHWNATTRWLRFMESEPSLAQAPIEVRRVLADKIHRPFARFGLTTAQRVDMLINHYTALAALLQPAALLELVAGHRLKLVEIQGREAGEVYVMTLSREMESQHQGELTIMFIEQATNVILARIVTNLTVDNDGRRVFLLSGLQGPHPAYKAEIVKVTRHLNGLRPKRAVVEAACALARWAKAEKLIATSKRNHVSQTKAKWQRKIYADYDTFWEEFIPTVLPDGDYQMPLVMPRKNADEVPSKKKKEWQLRCVRLDAINQDIEKVMTNLA